MLAPGSRSGWFPRAGAQRLVPGVVRLRAGGGFLRPLGHAVRARVAALAMASMVAAGSVRVMTWAPVMVLAHGVSGASQRIPQPAAARRLMRCWPPTRSAAV